jgi:predicted SAM-dependent methyltransferase
MGFPSKRLAPPGGVRVNLGSGTDYRDGWLNIDWNPTGSLRVDRSFNLEEIPWPLADASADYVYVSHVVEHMRHAMLYGVTRATMALLRVAADTGRVDDAAMARVERLASKDGLIALMEEIHRILRPGGLVDVVAPYALTPDAWKDPTHARGVEADFWTYFSTDALATRSFYSDARFRFVRQEHLRSLDYRAPFRWVGLKDYHARKYLGPLGGALTALGARRWHYTRLQKP